MGTCYVPEDLRRYFSGRWRIDRLAEDRRAGAAYRMIGTGAFQGDGGTLAYQEAVAWSVDGRRFTASRGYRYLFDAQTPAAAQVRFDDGRPFHALDLADGTAEVTHDCPPDRYDGFYRLLDADRFRVRWVVTGPRKDLVLSTLFVRVA